MAYSKYTTEVVFADHNLNVICNTILNALETEFDKVDVDTDFGITGTVAKIIQADPLVAVKGIAFATSNQAMFDYLKANMSKILKITGLIKFSDFMQVITTRLNIEVWMRESPITLIDTNGIFSEDKTEIPAYIM